MKKLIVANFKMNTTVKEFSNYLDKFLQNSKTLKNDVVFCVPYTHLMLANQKLCKTNILFGSQNISTEEKGAFTGEVSCAMVKDLGATYTIIGHSERRKMFKESDENINRKIKMALGVNLKVILCVGETKFEHNNNKTKNVLKRELEIALKGLYENELKSIVIAYEPVWAIGTGKTPSNKEIEITINDIRKIVADIFSEKVSEKICILYGGSVNENNSASILKINGVNGLLVGGASLDPEKFINIIK